MDDKDTHILGKPTLGNDDLELQEADAENVTGGMEVSSKRLKDYPTCPEGSVDDALCTPLTEDARYVSIREHGFPEPKPSSSE